MTVDAGRFRHGISAVLLVAATYVYFLLFAQFGFLQGIRAAGLDATAIKAALGAMAIGGVVTSLLAPRATARLGCSSTLLAGLLIAAVSSAAVGGCLGTGVRSLAAYVPAAIGIGVGLGLATVALAADLRRMTQGRNTGTIVGAGTGLAYLVCNLPGLYGGSPGLKAWTVTAVAGLGMVLTVVARGSNERIAENTTARIPEGWRGTSGLVAVVCAFGALVWFDSAAFAALQLSPEVHGRVWGTDTIRWINGGAHAVAAVVGGLSLDRGAIRGVLAVSLVLLVGGASAFRDVELLGRVAGPVYAAGVSLYSTALAAFAALDGRIQRTDTPAWRAAWLYAGAGWIGSAVGVGLAEDFRRLPGWAAPVAIVVFTAATAWSRRTRQPS